MPNSLLRLLARLFYGCHDSIFLIVKGTHLAKAGWLSMLFAIAYSATWTGFDSLRLHSGSHDVNPSYHSTCKYPPFFVLCTYFLIVVQRDQNGDLWSLAWLGIVLHSHLIEQKGFQQWHWPHTPLCDYQKTEHHKFLYLVWDFGVHRVTRLVPFSTNYLSWN